MRRTLDRLGLAGHERVLDVGCGTGTLLSAVQSRSPAAALTGVDLVPAMIAIARTKVSPNVGLVAANAEALPFCDGSFDVVASTSSFHFWGQPDLALAEVARVLVRGGRLVVTDWCDDFLACRAYDVVLRLVDAAHRRAYGAGECERFLRRCGFEVERIERYKLDWLWGMMTVRALKP